MKFIAEFSKKLEELCVFFIPLRRLYNFEELIEDTAITSHLTAEKE